MKRIGLAVALLGIGACAVPEDVSNVEQDVRSCPEGVCGANSPRIDNQGFHELQKYGLKNDEGIAITGFVKNGVSYQLDVTGNALSGTRPGDLIEHDLLVGAEIHVSVHGVDEWRIQITAVGSAPFFVAASGLPDAVETYVLEYGHSLKNDPPTTWTNVCGGLWVPPEDWIHVGDTMVNAETLGQAPVDSILFDSDRIDASKMTLNDRADTNWFNIGCAGHTLSKLFLTRNMIASQGSSSRSKHDERQATLKLLTGDYFGDGTPFTVAGQRIDWQGGGVSYFSPPGPLEARWDANGATCLNTPRMSHPTTAEGGAAFPDIETAITQHAKDVGRDRPRPCRPASPTAITTELRTSALR